MINPPFHTASVIISDSSGAFESLVPGNLKGLKASKKRITLSEIKDKEDLFLLTTGGDSGLISFETTWKKGNTRGPVTTIRLIDPGKDFEERFLGGMGIGEDWKKRQQAQEDLSKHWGAPIEETMWTGQHHQEKFTVVEAPMQGPPEVEEAKIAHDLLKTLYIAFGVGDRPELWSMFTGTVSMVELNVNSGAREITLIIYNDGGLLTYEDHVRNSLVKRGVTLPLQLPDGSFLEYVANAKPLENYLTEHEEVFDWHMVCVDLLENYLRQVRGTKYSVVLFPDINKVLKTHIKAINDRHQGYLSQRQKNFDAAVNRNFGAPVTSKDVLDAKKALLDIDKSKILKNITYARAFLSMFGFDLFYDSKRLMSKGGLLNVRTSFETGLLGAAYKDEQNSFDHIKKQANLIPRIVQPISTEESKASSSKPGFINIMEARSTLNKFERAFWGGTYRPPSFHNGVETNLKILKIWFDVLGIGDGISPIAVYGDSNLIDRYLYQKNNYKLEIKEEDSDKTQFELPPEYRHNFRGGLAQRVTTSKINSYKESTAAAIRLKTILNSIDKNRLSKKKQNDLEEFVENIREPGGSITDPSKILHKGDEAPLVSRVSRFRTSIADPELEAELIKYNQKHNSTMPLTVNDKANSAVKLAWKLGFPFFLYNVENPNVLSMDVKLNDNYFASLVAGFKDRQIPAVAAKILSEGDIKKAYNSNLVDAGNAILTGIREDAETSEVIQQLRRGLSANKNGLDTIVNNETDFGTFAFVIISNFVKNHGNQGGPKWVSKVGSLNPLSLYASVANQLSKHNYEVEIKTLPAFNLYGNLAITKNCIFLANDLDVHGFGREQVSWNRDSMHSGMYIIFGYEHVITASDIYSVFSLVRVPGKSF